MKYKLNFIVAHSPTQNLSNKPSGAAIVEITTGTDFIESNSGRSMIVPEFRIHPP